MTGGAAPAISLPEDPDLRAVILQAMAAAPFDEQTGTFRLLQV